jgi:hypothetical protein
MGLAGGVIRRILIKGEKERLFEGSLNYRRQRKRFLVNNLPYTELTAGALEKFSKFEVCFIMVLKAGH